MKRIRDRSVRDDKPDLDCSVCVLRKKGCRQAAEGTFCTRFRSAETEPEGTDPNAAWRRGDPVDF